MENAKQEIADMKKRVAELKRSYDAVKTLGYRGSYTSFAKKIGAVHKAGWTLPGHKYTGPSNDLENQVR